MLKHISIDEPTKNEFDRRFNIFKAKEGKVKMKDYLLYLMGLDSQYDHYQKEPELSPELEF